MLIKQDTPKKKKRKYSYVLRFPTRPASKQVGWQEVSMDIGKMNVALDRAQSVIAK